MIISELFEAPQQCPECGGISFSDLILAEKKDACYHKVKASAKVWPSAYASGRLVQCRKKGAANYGNKSEGVAETRKGQVPMTLKPGETDDLEPEDFEGFKQLPEYLEGQKAQQKAGKDLIQQSPYTYQSDQDWAYRNGAFDQRQAASSADFTKRGPLTTEQGLSEEELPSGNGTGGAKSLTQKALGKVGRAFMPTLGYTDAAERLSNKDYTGAGIAAAAGTIGLVPAWPAQLASGGLELVNMTRDEAQALGGYDKLAKEISKNFTPEYAPSYLPENPAQSEGVGTVYSGVKAAYNRGKDFVKYLRRDSGITSQDMATQRNVGGKAIPSLGEPGKVVTSPTVDQALTKLGGKNVDTTPGPTVKSGSSNDLNLDPVFDVPAYVRQGKSDPVTVPKPGSKPTIKIQPGETMIQAMQRAKDEQEFGKFLQGQGGQKFGKPSAAQTSGSDQVPTIKLPDGSHIVDPSRLSPSGKYGRLDKIARDDEAAVDAMVKKARENAEARAAAQSAKEKQLGLEPGSLRPKSQWEKERDSALRDEEKKLGLQPGSLSSRSQRQPEQTTTLPGEKENSGIFNYIKDNPKKSAAAAAAAGYAADELLKDKKLKEQSRKKRKEPEVDYDAIDHDKSVARLRHLAGIGPMKTVWDPARRVYKNVPTAVQPKR